MKYDFRLQPNKFHTKGICIYNTKIVETSNEDIVILTKILEGLTI